MKNYKIVLKNMKEDLKKKSEICPNSFLERLSILNFSALSQTELWL